MENFSLNLSDRKSLFWSPDYLAISAWIEHVPFAFWLIDVLRPQRIVELGVHNGLSYFAFCQAVKSLNINTVCYGVDTWQGDEHAGFYDEGVYKNVVQHNSVNYSRFSTLLQSSFDEAIEYFIDGSIDLLHIDGLHTYEIVKHDFETWQPKLSDNAFVIFHDINVRERHFGVFRLWEELKEKYQNFQFDFGHGLGIIAMGKIPQNDLECLFRKEKTNTYFFLRNLFSERGNFFKTNFENQVRGANVDATITALNAGNEQVKESLKSLESAKMEIEESFKTLQEAHNHINQQYQSLLQTHNTLYESQKDNLAEIESLNTKLNKSTGDISYLKKNIHELRLINKQLSEKYKSNELLLNRKVENYSFSQQRIENAIAEKNNTIRELVSIVEKHNQSIDWYKRTYEERSLLGILKEKLLNRNKNKPFSNGNFIRMIISKKIYPLLPVNDLQFLPDGGDYIASGSDPHFIADFKDEKIKAGWYFLLIEVEEIKEILLGTKIYYDYGNGFNEIDVWNLPHIHENKIECLIRIAKPLYRLRFDPSTGQCGFHIDKFNLRPVSQARVLTIAIERYKKNSRPDESYLRIYFEILKDYLKRGRSGIRERVWSSIKNKEDHSVNSYTKWCMLYDTISKHDMQIIKDKSAKLVSKPLFSIIMPVYNAPLVFLEKAIESVRNQAYDKWELCIADDKSTNKNVIQLLKQYEAKDSRIKVVYRNINGHISNATNSALDIATGDYLVLLDQDDEILPHALYLVAKAINENEDLGLIYSDEDKIDEKGQRFDPYFKTDWNRDLFYGHNMINHLTVYKRSLVKSVGGFRVGYEGSQDYDLALRCIEQLSDNQIYHIPHILYHWRAVKGSTSVTVSNKNYAVDAGINALNDHLKRTNRNATALKNVNNSYRVQWALPDKQPLVSIIIPTKDKADVLSVCVESLFKKTSYQNFEVLVIDNNSEEEVTHKYFETISNYKNVSIHKFSAPFNFSAMNNFGVMHSRGEIILLLNNDTEVINSEWLTELVSQCMREEIGVVGAKLYYPNGQIQHAGVFLSEGHPGIHIYLKRDKNDPGYINKLNLVQNYSAVTAACFAVRKEVFLQVGGLNEENLKVAYNDVDFCLNVKKAGYRNLWTPFAQLTHYESLSRGDDLNEINLPRFKKEQQYMLEKWSKFINEDPFFSPNLDIDTQTTQYAFPPKVLYEWQVKTD